MSRYGAITAYKLSEVLLVKDLTINRVVKPPINR